MTPPPLPLSGLLSRPQLPALWRGQAALSVWSAWRLRYLFLLLHIRSIFFLHQTMSNLNFLLIICLSRLRSSFCPVVMFAAVWCAAIQCRGVLCVAAAYCSVFVFTMAKTRVNLNILILLCIYASYSKAAVSSPYYGKRSEPHLSVYPEPVSYHLSLHIVSDFDCFHLKLILWK